MNNKTWTPEEEHDLLTMDRADFLEKYQGIRSYDGARIRFRDLQKQGAMPVPAVSQVEPDEDEDHDLSDEAYTRYFQSIFDANEADRELGSGVDVVQYTFGERLPIGVFFTSDWHLGSGGVEYRRLEKDLELLRDTPGAYGIFNGDGIENTKTHTKSASALYTAAIPKPKHQLELLRRMGSIAKEKWLSWGEGNHDAFDYRAAGVDRIAGIAQELGVPYFKEKGGTVKLHVGGVEYTIIVKHQFKGQSQISKSNSGRRMFQEFPFQWDNADVVALAHLHEPDLHITMQRGRDVHLLRSGSYKTKDGYAESNGFLPSYGVPGVILFPDERKIISFHGLQYLEAMQYLKDLRGDS